MSAFRFVTAAAVACLLTGPVLAQQSQDHSAHHPGGAAASAEPSQSGAASSQGGMMAMCQEMMGRMAGMGHGMTGSGMMGPGMMGQGMMGGSAAGSQMGPGGAMMGGMAERHVEGRLAFLKTELKITEAQGPQWIAFADVVRVNAKAAAERRRSMMPGQSASATLPERLAQQEKVLAANLDGLKKVEEMLGKLYAVLDADQKKLADGVVIGPMGMPMGMM